MPKVLPTEILHNPDLQELNKTLWLFSLVEISHLLFLVLVGGATLVLALRTLGATLGDVAVARVESLTRPWLRVGTVGGISSGIFMSIATALTLVANASFFVKILALGAAVLFGFALSGRLRGGESRTARCSQRSAFYCSGPGSGCLQAQEFLPPALCCSPPYPPHFCCSSSLRNDAPLRRSRRSLRAASGSRHGFGLANRRPLADGGLALAEKNSMFRSARLMPRAFVRNALAKKTS